MIDKKEIVARVVIFGAVEVLIAGVVLSYLGLERLLLVVLPVILLWGVYVYKMNVRVLGMPLQITGIEGAEGKALTAISDTGKVKVRGEIWNARSATPVEKGKKVRVMKREGIVLEVEPLEN